MAHILKYVIFAVYVLVSIALVVLILLQQGKPQGLGALSGSTVETYWSKNKGRSKEGMQRKATVVLSVLFFVLALLTDMNLF